ncbi:MAG: hypothetical protein K9K38_20160 [Rhodoferax sp.]|nr:hypothetical protein [Rhodoferax sp.]
MQWIDALRMVVLLLGMIAISAESHGKTRGNGPVPKLAKVLAKSLKASPSVKYLSPMPLMLPLAEWTPHATPMVTPADVLSPEQLRIAEHVLVGAMRCEKGVMVSVRRHPGSAGHFWLDAGRKSHLMLPVVTATGAVRLEAAGTGAVWIQLAHKSMLMNQKLGRRIADDCMHAEQWTVARNLALSPGPGLLDGPTRSVVSVRWDISAY